MDEHAFPPTGIAVAGLGFRYSTFLNFIRNFKLLASSVAAQAGLCQTWLEPLKTSFLALFTCFITDLVDSHQRSAAK